MRLQRKSTLKNIILHPIFILFVFNIIFFIKPIVKGLYISPADALQRFPSFNLGEFYKPQNSLLFDSVTQFQSWYKYLNSNLKVGVLPLWNNLNSNGVPLFANNISAFLFLPSFIMYFIPLPLGLFIFYFTKEILILIFTYLFLRELRIKTFPSLMGALAFGFCGFNITWLMWPQTNVVIFLPLFLYLIEKLFNERLSLRKFCLFYSISLAFAFFAGHPETLFHIVLVTSLYFLYKLRITENKFKYIRIYFLANLFGLLVSLIQTLPFLEYLINSWALYERQTHNIGSLLPLYSIVYNIFPNLSGNPSTDFYHSLFNSNYNELAGAYVGPITTLLGIICILFYLSKDRRVAFFSFLGLMILPFIYKVPIFSPMAMLFSKIIANIRLQFILAFIQSVLAAILLDRYLYSKQKVFRLKIFGIFAILLIVISPILTNKFLPIYLADQNKIKVDNFVRYLNLQILFLGGTLLLGIFLISKAKRINKIIFHPLYFILIYSQTALFNIKYNPAIENKYFYPETDGIRFLENLPKGRFMELGGDYIIPANTNLVFGIPSVHNYDALEIRDHQLLFDRVFNNKTSWNTILNTDEKYLDLFGVKYILSYTDIDNKIINNQIKDNLLLGELTSDIKIRQEFNSESNDLYGIRLLPANYNRKNNCRFQFSLFEKNSERKIFEDIISCTKVYDKIYFDINFPVIKDSSDKKYRFELNVFDGYFGNTISFWKNTGNDLVMDTKYEVLDKENFEKVYDGKFKIFENTNLTPDFYLVNKIINSGNEEEAIRKILKNEVDFKNEAVLLNTNINIDNNGTNDYFVEVASQTNDNVVLRIKSRDNSFLATKLSYYPGWIASIDSKKTKIYRTNIAFQGIIVPAGEHIIEFKYRPLSFYGGLFLSAFGVIVLIKYLLNEKERN